MEFAGSQWLIGGLIAMLLATGCKTMQQAAGPAEALTKAGEAPAAAPVENFYDPSEIVLLSFGGKTSAFNLTWPQATAAEIKALPIPDSMRQRSQYCAALAFYDHEVIVWSSGSACDKTRVPLQGLKFSSSYQDSLKIHKVFARPGAAKAMAKIVPQTGNSSALELCPAGVEYECPSLSLAVDQKLVDDISRSLLARQLCGKYEGSEAADLIRERARRLSYGRSIDTVTICGKSVSTAYIPPIEVRGYRIDSEELAQKSGFKYKEVVPVETVQANEALTDALIDGGLTELQTGAISKDYAARPVGQICTDEVQALQNEIGSRIAGKFYSSADGSLSVNAGHTRQFSALMDALQTDNRAAFVDRMVELALLFGRNKAEARSGFVSAFTVLYVTKNFPSLGVRQQYLHFVLRCGGIY